MKIILAQVAMAAVAIGALLVADAMSPAGAQSPRVYGADGQYLGNLNNNQFDPNSVNNPFGQYGSQFSPNSVNNQFGKYGSPFSPYSANNPFAR